MDEILERVKANRPALERWLRLLPGYAGYKEKEQRRDADRILRETIRRRLRELADRLLGLQRELSERDLARVDEIDRIVRQLQTLADQVGVARYGYAGFLRCRPHRGSGAGGPLSLRCGPFAEDRGAAGKRRCAGSDDPWRGRSGCRPAPAGEPASGASGVVGASFGVHDPCLISVFPPKGFRGRFGPGDLFLTSSSSVAWGATYIEEREAIGFDINWVCCYIVDLRFANPTADRWKLHAGSGIGLFRASHGRV